jgi:hypothetical protein
VIANRQSAIGNLQSTIDLTLPSAYSIPVLVAHSFRAIERRLPNESLIYLAIPHGFLMACVRRPPLSGTRLSALRSSSPKA